MGRALFVGILLAAAVLALTIFFQVDTITVVGASKYSAEELVAGMDVKKGDNLYLWNKIKTANSLTERFPYLETVQIRRHLPDAIVVTVTECKAVLAVPSDGGYFLLSAQGKVLERRATDGGLPVVTGVSLMGMQPGQTVTPDADAYTDALLTALQTLDEAGMLDEVDFINMQSLTDVRIGYLRRFDIRVGTTERLGYRLRFVQTVIAERLSPSDTGRLYWDSKARLHFVPDTAENVAKSAVGGDDSAPVQLDPDGAIIDDGAEEQPDNGQQAGEDDGDGGEAASGGDAA